MNSNCLTVIVKALRRLGVIASGALPTQEEQDDALATLTALYRRWITDGAFSPIRELVDPAGDVTALINTRYVFTTDEARTITRPATAPDGSIIIFVDRPRAQIEEWVYDGQAERWIDLSDLNLTDPAPFSHRDIIGLSCALAIELADEYGQSGTISDATRLAAARYHSGLINNWSVPDATSGDWRVYF